MPTITVNRHISMQFMRDVMTTAVEGGINYWGHVHNVRRMNEHGTIDTANDLSVIIFMVTDREALVDAIQDHGWTVEEALRSDEMEHWLVHGWSLSKAIQKIIEGSVEIHYGTRDDIIQAVIEADSGYIDAEAADAIVQVALFDKIVYG